VGSEGRRRFRHSFKGDPGAQIAELRRGFFHAQQCAEKYLKAFLQEAEISFGKSHHLIALLELALGAEQPWKLLRPQLKV
jgi:hypothetical protein